MRILILSPHADDAQIAAGGTAFRLLEDGHEAFYVAFSICEESVPEGFPPDILDIECRKACADLAIPTDNVEIKRYRVRHFPSVRQEILEEMIELRQEFDPDLIFLPSTSDVHQDHAVVASEGIRAFRRHCSLYGYDFPWNVLHTATLNLFVELSELHLKAKMAALKHFESQLAKESNCLTEDYIRSLAVERGNRIGVQYAEAFEVVREVRRIDHGLFL